MRCRTRLPWYAIADNVGYKTASGARRAALRYAKKHKKKPPPIDYLSQGEMAYEIRLEEGVEWGDIAVELETKTDYARKNAERYAKRRGKTYPI